MKKRTVAIMMEVETKLKTKEIKDYFVTQVIPGETVIKQIQVNVIDKTKK